MEADLDRMRRLLVERYDLPEQSRAGRLHSFVSPRNACVVSVSCEAVGTARRRPGLPVRWSVSVLDGRDLTGREHPVGPLPRARPDVRTCCQHVPGRRPHQAAPGATRTDRF